MRAGFPGIIIAVESVPLEKQFESVVAAICKMDWEMATVTRASTTGNDVNSPIVVPASNLGGYY